MAAALSVPMEENESGVHDMIMEESKKKAHRRPMVVAHPRPMMHRPRPMVHHPRPVAHRPVKGKKHHKG